MLFRNGALIGCIGIALLVSSARAVAEDWISIKNPGELRNLFSNKTFRTHEKIHGWIAHFRDDGRGISKGVLTKADNTLHFGSPSPRKWEIKGTDQVCITSLDTSAVSCYRFQRHRKLRNEFMMTNVSSNYVDSITVEDGIPTFQ